MLPAISRRQFVTRFVAFGAAMAAGMSGVLTGCGGQSFASTPTPTPVPQNASSPLRDVAGNKAILFGAATGQANLQVDADFAAAFARHAGILVPENELKWETVEPQPNSFNFAPGDWLADFATQNSMRFRGHVLVWHQQLPSWAGTHVTAAEAQQQLTNHVSQVVAHYAGRVHSWDVVNEAVNPSDGRSDYLRKTVWLNAIGPSYIETAFHAAAQADPNALLVYNDYGLEYDTSEAALRRAGVLRLLKSLKDSGTPIHALGIQAHLPGSGASFDTLPGFLKQVADLGLKIFVSELDVSDQNLPAAVDARDDIVATVYQHFLDAVLQQSAVEAVLTWGLSDRYTWLSHYAPRSDGQPVRPLPLDARYQPKCASWAIINALNATSCR